ncbi:LAFE_0H06744g1_1 [Lachancea fermentati]|uniref:Small ribosomal subunit protein mS35 n=1 Tax=Lachancea fermentati TaxID=4955 RepID=A0A1G4MJU5_LACFM|nr:LAFE_0H06744g1_1 [Lachancea fermentati]
MRASLKLLIRSTSVCLDGGALKVAREATLSPELYLEPGKWKGLKPDQIFQLYRERVVRLGSEYKPCKEELDALLSTSEYTGVSATAIKSVYRGGEQAAHDVAGISLEDDFKPKPFMFDDLPSQAQLLVQQHREQRFYNRLAAYELPLLAQYRQKYERPSTKTKPVTYRYTTYIGEDHPNSRKVVLNVKTRDLGLNDRELHKLRVLARTRYDHTTDVFKMSCDSYPEAAQNARYLSELLERLIKESKDMTDDFSDVPLDTRHTVAKHLRNKKRHYEFPEEWKRPEDAPKKLIDVVALMKKNF